MTTEVVPPRTRIGNLTIEDTLIDLPLVDLAVDLSEPFADGLWVADFEMPERLGGGLFWPHFDWKPNCIIMLSTAELGRSWGLEWAWACMLGYLVQWLYSPRGWSDAAPARRRRMLLSESIAEQLLQREPSAAELRGILRQARKAVR